MNINFIDIYKDKRRKNSYKIEIFLLILSLTCLFFNFNKYIEYRNIYSKKSISKLEEEIERNEDKISRLKEDEEFKSNIYEQLDNITGKVREEICLTKVYISEDMSLIEGESISRESIVGLLSSLNNEEGDYRLNRIIHNTEDDFFEFLIEEPQAGDIDEREEKAN